MGGLSGRATRSDLQSGWCRAEVVSLARLGPHDVMDTSQFSPTVWKAVSCHKTQMTIYKNLEHLSDENHKAIWGTQEFYRAFSLVNGGRARESDLFEGLR